jgi:KUP system potassium uptake protein
VPVIWPDERVEARELAPRVWRANVQFGFMERPNIPAVLERLKAQGLVFDLGDITYYMPHEQIVSREERPRLPRFVSAVFAYLQRNSAPLTDYFRVPRERVVEIGRAFAI